MSVLVRVLHIAATCTSLGGLFYARVVLLPALRAVPASAGEALLRTALRRFAWVKWTGVIVVALTGVVQWVAVFPTVVDRRRYLMCFALKMAGALGLFSITFALALPTSTRMHARRGLWSAINVACGLAILIGAALMRDARAM